MAGVLGLPRLDEASRGVAGHRLLQCAAELGLPLAASAAIFTRDLVAPSHPVPELFSPVFSGSFH